MNIESEIKGWKVKHSESYAGMITLYPPSTKFNGPRGEEPVSLTVPSELLLEIAGRFMKNHMMLRLEVQSGLEVLLDQLP